jgi:outer membrane protein insertion porin family
VNSGSGQHVCFMMRLLALAAVALLLLRTSSVRAQPEPQPEPPAAPAPPPAQAAPPPAAAPADAPLAPDTWGAGVPAPPAAPAEPPGSDGPDDEEMAPAPRGALPSGDGGPAAGRVRYVLENIEVRGNSRTRSRVVLRYLPFRAGDVLDVDDPEVELARYRLLGTGFFRDVQFALRKGSRRGWVVLVIEVVERNTIIINDLWMGLSQTADTSGEQTEPLTAYAGIDVAETNLAGTGITLGSAFGVAEDQLALRVRFLDPAFLGGRWMTTGTLLYNDAKDFFGNADVVYVDPTQERVADHAVVEYTRFGGALGVGRDLSVPTQLWLHYRLESIEASLPLAASHSRGLNTEPIDFNIVRGRSVLSALRANVQLDTRDQPILPTRGWFVGVTGEVGLAPLGSDYGYVRLDAHASKWWQLPWKEHVVRLELFGGAILGGPPFFEQYYVGDFSDFLPGRVLGVNFDRRPPPNFLSTQIVEVRYGTYAAKVGGEYRIPLYRGQRSVYGIDFFTSFGIYSVFDERALSDPPRGYSGAALIPVDLTANLGFRMDTSVGGFVFAFSNVLGFIPVRGQEPAGAD